MTASGNTSFAQQWQLKVDDERGRDQAVGAAAARAGALSRRGRRQAEAAARTGHEGEPGIERCELRPEELGECHVPGLIAGQARAAAPLAGLLLPQCGVGYLRGRVGVSSVPAGPLQRRVLPLQVVQLALETGLLLERCESQVLTALG